MTNFIGDYTCKLDAKGRVTFPSAFKKQMTGASQDKFVIKKDIYEDCLVLYTLEEWETQNTAIMKRTNPYNKKHNQFLREFFKGTAELQLDANSRLLIPKRLLSEIEDATEIVMAGQFNKIEIWNKIHYDNLGANENDFQNLAENILGGHNNDDD